MNTIRASRVLRRLMLPVALLLGFLLWWKYGTLRVPSGMDTLAADFPPGTLCVVDKHPGAVVAGQVVFVEVGGGLLLTRIGRRADGQVWIDHDDASRFPDGDALGPLPQDAVHAVVLSGFRPDAEPTGVPDGGR